MSNTTTTALDEADHLANKGPIIVGICWAFTAISAVFVASRIYVRGFILRKYHLDDLFTVLSIICGFIGTSLSTIAVAHGNGKHKDDLSYEQQQNVILWTTAAFCPGIMSFSLPKLAVIALLTQLLKPSTVHKWFLWTMGILCQFALLSTVGVLLGQCNPTRSLWDWSIEGKCFDKKILIAYCIATAVFSAFVDLYLALYPAVVLFKLQMPLKKKLALTVALGIGTIGGLVAIYKTTRIPALSSEDFSYDTSDLVLWTVIEGSTLIIACSMPTLKPLMSIIFRAAKTATGSKDPTTAANQYFKGSGGSRGAGIMTWRKNKTKKDKYGMTIATQCNDDIEMGSQEKILEQDEATSMESGAGTGGAGVLVAQTTADDGTIVRTDSVTVSYENKDQRKMISPSFGGQFKGASASMCKAG